MLGKLDGSALLEKETMRECSMLLGHTGRNSWERWMERGREAGRA